MHAVSLAAPMQQKKLAVARDFIPLKVNSAGVMPIIFAQAIMFIPATIAGFASRMKMHRVLYVLCLIIPLFGIMLSMQYW